MDASIKILCTFFSTKALDLLLPNSAIAEVIINKHIKNTEKNPTHWIVGQLLWQEKNIFVIDYDKLDPKTEPNPTLKIENTENNKYIIIIRNPAYSKSDNSIQFFGISINKIPHIIEANTHNLNKDLQPNITHTYAASYASINNKVVIIPSISHVFSAIENNT